MKIKKSWNILLIDDDQDEFILLNDMVESIQERTVHLKWVNSSLLGLKEVQGHRYDAVLVDFNLGGKKNGLDFIQEVRSGDHSLPLILYTGSDDRTLFLRAYADGASFFLSKASTNAQVLWQILHCLIEPDYDSNLRDLDFSTF